MAAERLRYGSFTEDGVEKVGSGAARSRIGVWGLACLTLIFLAGCDRSGEASPSPDPVAGTGGSAEVMEFVATVGMVGDVVRAVAGEHAEVETLIRPGVDPHLYRPTRDAMAALQSADAVFYVGLLLEGKMTDALIRTANEGRRVFAVAEAVDPSVLLEPEDFAGHYDPHLWMDPALWVQTVDIVRERLAEMDPDHADDYAANAAAFKTELEQLDAYAERALATVPESRRVLVTAHDAFNYFGRRFGFEVVGIQGLSTESEAGVRDIERLVDLLVERDVPAVFVESTVPEKNVRALIDGARQRGHAVTIGGELFSDAMGEVGTYEGTYVGMIDHNVTTVARALGGEAPPEGMRDRLGSEVTGQTRP